jgi:hypothetical protein
MFGMLATQHVLSRAAPSTACDDGAMAGESDGLAARSLSPTDVRAFGVDDWASASSAVPSG